MENLIALSPILLWLVLAVLLIAVLFFIIKRAVKRHEYKKKIQALEENNVLEESLRD